MFDLATLNRIASALRIAGDEFTDAATCCTEQEERDSLGAKASESYALESLVGAAADALKPRADGMREFCVCLSWGSREEGTFEENFTARDESHAVELCRLAMAASESDADETQEGLEAIAAENAESWYVIHCYPDDSAANAATAAEAATLRRCVGELFVRWYDVGAHECDSLFDAWREESAVQAAENAERERQEGGES